MNVKTANYISLIMLIALGIGYWLSSRSFGGGLGFDRIGPGYYPQLLAYLLIILCIISFVQSMKKKEENKISIPRLRLVILTVIIIGLFILSWYLFDSLFINLFLFLFILFTVYRFKEFNKKILIMNFIVSSVTTVIVFVVFDLLLGISF